MNRLTDEVIDHWDNNFDQTESYEYDLTGNRTSVGRLSEAATDPSTLVEADYDQITEYRYDANDRLFAELSDDQTTDNADTTTIYGYDHTQQTAKTVYTSLLDEATIDSLVDDGDDTGLDPTTELPFHDLMAQRLASSETDASATLAELTQHLVTEIRKQIALVGFWSNATKQDELRKFIKQDLDASNLFDFGDLDKLAADLVDLTKANQHKLSE
jgi:hypothetical protein